MGGAAIIGGLTTLWAGNKSAKATANAANSAAAAQTAANNAAISSQEKMLGQQQAFTREQLANQRAGFMPYETAGKRALMDYEYLTTGRLPNAAEYTDAVAQSNRGRIAELTAQLQRVRAGQPAIETTSAATPSSVAVPVSVATTSQPTEAEIMDELNKLTAATPGTDLSRYAENYVAPDATNTPIYEWRDRNLQRTTQQGLRARGIYNTTNGQEAEMGANMALTAEETDKQINRVADLMNAGTSASQTLASSSNNAVNSNSNATTNASNQISEAIQNTGSANANAALVAGNAKVGLYSGLGTTLQDMFRTTTPTTTATAVTQPSTSTPATQAANSLYGLFTVQPTALSKWKAA